MLAAKSDVNPKKLLRLGSNCESIGALFRVWGLGVWVQGLGFRV